MSNALAIAAVTTMLDYLITLALASSMEVSLESVTAKPPDKARDGGEGTNQINLFLYQTLPNAAWRNRDIPNRVKPGERARSPLALTLAYLITAYGKNNDDIEGQQLLGMAMQSLHDHPEIRPQDIEQALDSTNLSPGKKALLASSNLKNQIDRVRITPRVLSVEEVSKMWATFQTPYRISAAYEASVVLVDSAVAVKAAPPVLTIGSENRGVLARPDLIVPIPTLETLTWPSLERSRQQSITLGEALTLKGHHLDSPGTTAFVRFRNPHLSEPVEIALPSPLPANAVTMSFPEDADSTWVAGFYTLALRYHKRVNDSDYNRFSNALSLAVAPTISPGSINVSADSLALTCSPPVQRGQSVALLLGSREILLQRDPDDTAALTDLRFSLAGIPPGKYWLRLRVDGVDSHLVTVVNGQDAQNEPEMSNDRRLRFNPEYEVRVPEVAN
jgi:hypothetical protein